MNEDNLNRAAQSYLGKLSGSEAQLPAEELERRRIAAEAEALAKANEAKLFNFMQRVDGRILELSQLIKERAEIRKTGDGGGQSANVFVSKTSHYEMFSAGAKPGVHPLQISADAQSNRVEAMLAVPDISVPRPVLSEGTLSGANDAWIDDALEKWLASAAF